jgi:hypothetical protein
VFSDRIGVRLLVISSLLLGASLSLVAVVFVVRFATDWGIPGWATTATGILAILALQGFMMMVVFSMVVLGGRGAAGFLPVRDYMHYVSGVERVR